MNIKMKFGRKNKYVTLWNIYLQQWQQYNILPDDAILASLNENDRQKVINYFMKG